MRARGQTLKMNRAPFNPRGPGHSKAYDVQQGRVNNALNLQPRPSLLGLNTNLWECGIFNKIDSHNPTTVYVNTKGEVGVNTTVPQTTAVYYKFPFPISGSNLVGTWFTYTGFTASLDQDYSGGGNDEGRGGENLTSALVTEDWNENTLTWNTRPASSTSSAVFGLDSVGGLHCNQIDTLTAGDALGFGTVIFGAVNAPIIYGVCVEAVAPPYTPFFLPLAGVGVLSGLSLSRAFLYATR